jgi:hypothetical protein
MAQTKYTHGYGASIAACNVRPSVAHGPWFRRVVVN